MALTITVTKVGAGTLAERTFSREARSKGITFGSVEDADVSVMEFREDHAVLERREDGYWYRDNSGMGFSLNGIRHEGNSAARVTDGNRLMTAGLVIEFKRSVVPIRPEAAAPTGETRVLTPTGTHTSLQAMSHAAMKDLSRYFVGEGNFTSIGEVRRFKTLLKLFVEIGIEWMSTTLHGRAEFQDQFSAPVTQLYHQTLNPLKGMRDLSSIALYLLDWREDRDIEKIKLTMRNAFNDMVKHQMGMLAGVKALVETIQQKLDPEKIQEKAGGGLFGGGSKKAWEIYSDMYAETFAESSRLFNEVIYPSIRQGYIFSHDSSDVVHPTQLEGKPEPENG